jgi:DNA-binding IclR family transcriptional regulator
MIVRQAGNVLDLLEFFAQLKRPANLAEISASLKWPRSSTFNLLTTLALRGFLYEPRPRAGYYPSQRWLSLLRDIADADQLPEELCEATREVAADTGETVAICAPAGPAGVNAVLLYIVESAEPIRFSASVGYQMPLHATAGGRALLAQYAPRERETVLKKTKYEKFSTRALQSSDQVEAEIKRAATRGWHENVEGFATDMAGVAISVPLAERRLSLVVGGPSSRMRRQIPEVAATLRRVLKRRLPALRLAEIP